jgi:hypothetical protein
MRRVQAVDTQYVTTTLTPVPLTSAEIMNPQRGYYQWAPTVTVPQPAEMDDAYGRYAWKDLEPVKDQYNFSLIDNAIATAVSKGQKFAFRIRDLKGPTSGVAVPDYIISEHLAWAFSSTYIPDWSNPLYQDRVKKLVAALSVKYNGNPHIAWIDMGMFGQYGEWSLGGVDYSQAPAGVVFPDDLVRRGVVDMWVNTFPDTHLVMMAKTSAVNASLYPGGPVYYALAKTMPHYPIGWRVDCLGRNGYFDFPTNSAYQKQWSLMQDRWKIAPVVVEFCTDSDVTAATTQVHDFHISSVGNGNLPSWSTYTDAVKAQYGELGKGAGYRYAVTSFRVPSSISTGTTFTVDTTWINQGNAPAYEPWDINIQLLSSADKSVVWQSKLSIDLKTILDSSAHTFSQSFTLPSTLPQSSYIWAIRITDPRGTRQPMHIANTNTLLPTGAYTFSNVQVGVGTVTGDTDGDRDVDMVDYQNLVTNFGQAYPAADFNGNGKVDIYDYNTLIINIGAHL